MEENQIPNAVTVDDRVGWSITLPEDRCVTGYKTDKQDVYAWVFENKGEVHNIALSTEAIIAMLSIIKQFEENEE